MDMRDRVELLTTRVFAIKRAPTPPGVDPRNGEVLDVLNLGPNVLTQKGRHVLMARMAGTGAAQLPAGNTYLDVDGWHLQFMSLGSNDDSGGATAADTANTQLNNELVGSLKAFTSPAGSDVDEVLNVIEDFKLINDTGDSFYTHIAWRCLYAAGEGNGAILEVGLWFPDGTANPAGSFVPTADNGVLASRGPLAARKVLDGVITKNSSFSLEFVWVWMG